MMGRKIRRATDETVVARSERRAARWVHALDPRVSDERLEMLGRRSLEYFYNPYS